jgi:hypothetical protein
MPSGAWALPQGREVELTQNISKYLKIWGGFDPPIGALA